MIGISVPTEGRGEVGARAVKTGYVLWCQDATWFYLSSINIKFVGKGSICILTLTGTCVRWGMATTAGFVLTPKWGLGDLS